MQAAVAAEVERVVMAGSNCALGHGYRTSQTPFFFRALPIDEGHPAFPEDSYSYSNIPRLYAAGEICSVFQFVSQSGGNLAECIVFGRIAGQNAAAEVPLKTA